jgi:hypothetical protein
VFKVDFIYQPQLEEVLLVVDEVVEEVVLLVIEVSGALIQEPKSPSSNQGVGFELEAS